MVRIYCCSFVFVSADLSSVEGKKAALTHDGHDITLENEQVNDSKMASQDLYKERNYSFTHPPKKLDNIV